MERYKRYLSPSTPSYYQEPVIVDRPRGFGSLTAPDRSNLDFFGGFSRCPWSMETSM